MPRNPVIAVVQMKYFELCRSNNVDEIKRYIQLAKKKKADIVCFPETCVHRSEWLHKGHPMIKEIREECRKNSIWCIITEHIYIKGKDFNAALLIDRNGKIKGVYKKINLYGDVVNPGKKVRVFDTDFGRIGIAICWDLAFPELFRKMRRAGAQIVFCPSKWWYDKPAHKSGHIKREIKILQFLIRARAYENLCYIALCNPVLRSKFQVSYSAIACPHGIRKEIIGKEGMITSRVDLKELGRLKKIFTYKKA